MREKYRQQNMIGMNRQAPYRKKAAMRLCKSMNDIAEPGFHFKIFRAIPHTRRGGWGIERCRK